MVRVTHKSGCSNGCVYVFLEGTLFGAALEGHQILIRALYFDIYPNGLLASATHMISV